MGVISGGLLFHASGGMLDHERLTWMMPVLPLLLLASVGGVNLAQRHGYLDRPLAQFIAARPLVIVAATLSSGAAVIHVSVIRDHLDEWLVEGVFFIAVSIFQIVWAVAYARNPTRRLALTAALGNAIVVGGWLMSRTVGLPVGPEPWLPMAMGLSDLIATAFEVVLVGVLIRGTHRRPPLEQALVLASFGLGSVAALTAFALIGTVA